MFPHIKVELRAEDKFFGPGVCELLELIEQTGSLQSACTEMGLSYSKGSRMLRGIERQLGSVGSAQMDWWSRGRRS